MASVLQPQVRTAMREPRSFYVSMATICLLVAVAGFFPTYWLPMAGGALRAHPLVHVHAFLFFGWTVFFLAQTHWVASGRIVRHRAFGVAGVALATAMMFAGVLLAIHSLKSNLALGVPHARAFSIVPISGIAFFAVVVAMALLNVRHADVHKRLMLLGSISILQAAVARWFQLALQPPDAVGPPPVVFTIAAGLVIDLLVVAAIVFDWRTRGRPHRVYVVGGACLLALQVLRVPLSEMAWWTAVADGMLALAP